MHDPPGAQCTTTGVSPPQLASETDKQTSTHHMPKGRASGEAAFSLDTPRCRPPPIDTYAVAAAVAQSLTEPRNEPIIFDEELFVLDGEAVTARGYEEDTSLVDAVRVSRCVRACMYLRAQSPNDS